MNRTAAQRRASRRRAGVDLTPSSAVAYCLDCPEWTRGGNDADHAWRQLYRHLETVHEEGVGKRSKHKIRRDTQRE